LWDSHALLSSTYAQQAEQLRDILAIFHTERLKEGASTMKNGVHSPVLAHRKEVHRCAVDAAALASSFKRSLGFCGTSEACADAKKITADPTCAEQQQQQELQETQCAPQGQLLEQRALRPPLRMGSGEQVQRLGRFTVFAAANDTAPPAELLGMKLEEVHTFFASTDREFGTGKTHAHVLDATVMRELPQEHAPKSRNGNRGLNLSDINSVASSQHPSVSTASLCVSSNHLVEEDEALNLWETLGNPLERTTKRNKALEDENKRLQKEVTLKKSELQELQHRAQTRTRSHANSLDGDASIGSSTRASTPICRSSSNAPVLVTASPASTLHGNSGPPELDEAALPLSGTARSPQMATGSSSSSCAPHASSSAATQVLLTASSTSSGASSGAFGSNSDEELSSDASPLWRREKPPSPLQTRDASLESALIEATNSLLAERLSLSVPLLGDLLGNTSSPIA